MSADRHPRNEELKRYARQHGFVLESVKERPDGILVLSKDGPDPFYVRPFEREWAEWFRDQWRRFIEQRGHVRRLHYAGFAAGDVIAPHGRRYGTGRTDNPNGYQNDWLALSIGSRAARYLGLVDPEMIDDARNAELVVNAWPRWTPPEARVTVLADPEDRAEQRWRMPYVATTIADPEWAIPDALFTVAGYDYEPVDQPVDLALVVEKSTMDDILRPLCRQLRVNLLTGLGFESITRIIELCRRAALLDRHVHVMYVSDCDLSGRAMPFQFARQIQFWVDQLGLSHRLTLHPLALTPEQVRRYEARGIVLPQDPTAPGKVELDALEVIIPGELARLVEDEVARWRDPTLEDRLNDAAGQVRDALDDAAEPTMLDLSTELAEIRDQVGQVNARFRERQEQLAREYREAVRPHAERLDRLWDRMIEQAREVVDDVVLPERPEPEPPEALDGDGLLFDSERGWLDSLDAFKRGAHGNGSEPS